MAGIAAGGIYSQGCTIGFPVAMGCQSCAARQTSARTKESSQSQQGKPVAGQASGVGSAQTPAARKSLEQSRLPPPCQGPSSRSTQGSKKGNMCLFGSAPCSATFVHTPQHKPSAASSAIQFPGLVPWTPARKCAPRVSPSENTERSCNFSFCTHANVQFEKN